MTPTTLLVSISSCRLPVCSRSPGQVVQPDGYTGGGQRRKVGILSHRFFLSTQLSSARSAAADDGFGGEPEFAEQRLVVGGFAVVLDRDDLAGVADQLVPALRDAGLDGDPRRHRRRQHAVAVLLAAATRTTRHTASTPPCAMMSLSANSFCASTASCTSEPVAISTTSGVVGRVAAAQHVAALGDALGAGALQHRDALAGQDETDRTAAVAAGQDGAPGVGGLVRVAGPHHRQVRDGPQRRQVLDRLVGRAVLAETDRVVRPDVDGVDVHQRRQPHRRAHVVGELQERAAEGAGRAVQHDAGQDRAHRVFADAEVQHAAVPVRGVVLGRDRRRAEGLHALDGGVVAARQVGRAAPQLGQLRRRRR